MGWGQATGQPEVHTTGTWVRVCRGAGVRKGRDRGAFQGRGGRDGPRGHEDRGACGASTMENEGGQQGVQNGEWG